MERSYRGEPQRLSQPSRGLEMRRLLTSLALVAVAVGLPATVQATTTSSGTVTTSEASNFQLIGHDPLFGRGMNSALAIFGDFLYVGSRTDGSSECVPPTGVPDPAVQTCPHIHPGVQVVNIHDPANPHVVGEIGPPLEGNVRETSRELRVWPQRKLLIVQNMRCSNFYHGCPPPPPTPAPNFRFYGIGGANAAHPQLISTYFPDISNLKDPRPHEFFLWVDPNNPNRALMYWTTYSNDNGSLPNIIVTDISRARQGIFRDVAKINLVHLYAGPDLHRLYVAVHSLSVSPDGSRAYVAVWGGTYLELDTSDLANGVADPSVNVLTPVDNRPTWPNPNGHSAVKVPGRPLVVMTDEIYGDYDRVNDAPLNHSGCPWGWMRLIDISDPVHPVIVGEYKTEQNTDAYCQSAAGQDPSNTTYTSYASHNPTVLPDLAFIDWHSSGLRAIDISNPAAPSTAGFFVPEPLPSVATEDPALSRGINKVVLWSYPIIYKGLIYAIDIRNGLYILRYSGPHADEVESVGFLEGNSNLGDALRLDQSP
jgi:LVIVD repeat